MTMAGAQQCLVIFLTAAFHMDRAGSGAVMSILGASGLFTQLVLLPLLHRCLGDTHVLVLGLLIQAIQNILMIVPNLDVFLVSTAIGGAASMVFPSVAAIKANA